MRFTSTADFAISVRWKSRFAVWAVFVVIFGVVLAVFKLPPYDAVSGVAAWLLVAICTLPFVFFESTSTSVPLFELTALVHAVMFGLGPLTQDSMDIWLSFNYVPSAGAIERTLICACLAMSAMWLGYAARFQIPSVFGSRKLDLRLKPRTAAITGAVMILGSVIVAGGRAIPESLRQPANLIFSTSLGSALLAVVYNERKWRPFGARWLLLLPLLYASLFGLLQGVGEAFVTPAVVMFLATIGSGKGRAARFLVIAGIAFFALQPIKGVYRRFAWQVAPDAAWSEKAGVLGDAALNYWTDNLSVSAMVDSITESSGARLSYLLGVAHIVDNTPVPVPYQNGRTLEYMLGAWIPRLVWPNKPTAQEANIQFVRAFGILPPDAEYGTMVGITDLGEVYWNFGIWGIMPAFFAIGTIIRYTKRCIIDGAEGIGSRAVAISIAVGLLQLGSSLAGVIAGVLSQLVVQGAGLNIIRRMGSVARPGEPVRKSGVLTGV